MISTRNGLSAVGRLPFLSFGFTTYNFAQAHSADLK
jgi:hypothetical protein